MNKQRLMQIGCGVLLFMSHIAAAKSYSFGVVPQQSASKLAELWTPIVLHLSEQTGLQIQFATAPDIPTFEKRLASGEYDFAYMNPYHFTVYHQQPGYQALAKAKNKQIKGIMVVRKDSGITALHQLNQKTLAFPAPAAFAASILTRAHLNKIGVTFTPKYVSSHDSVYRSVAMGLYPAGGGVIRTFNNIPETIRQQLEVLWTTQGYTPHAFAVHPGVDKADQRIVQQALIEMSNTAGGLTLLESLKLKGLESANNSDWDDVRGLNIELLSSNHK